jgi:hypothetical protein
MKDLQRHLARTCTLFTALVVGGLTGRSLSIYWGYMPLTVTFNPVNWTVIAYGFIVVRVLSGMILERTPEKW